MPRTFIATIKLEYPANPDVMSAASMLVEVLETGIENWLLGKGQGSLPLEVTDLHFYKGE